MQPKAHLSDCVNYLEFTLSFIELQESPRCSTVSSRTQRFLVLLCHPLHGMRSPLIVARWWLNHKLHISHHTSKAGRKEWDSLFSFKPLSLREPFKSARKPPHLIHRPGQDYMSILDQPLAQENGLHESPQRLRTSPTFPRYMI